MIEIIKMLFNPYTLLITNLGVAAGIIIGAIPGLNTVFAIAVLLPITFSMGSVDGMLLLLGAYCGSTFGGSITAILFNTPGTAGNAATVLDGYPLSLKGRSGDALKISLVSSSIGGIVSAATLLFLAPIVSKFTLYFGAPELFALCIFGMATVVGVSNKKILKGLIMAIIGLLVSTVGMDSIEGSARFVFGSSNLLGGIKPVVLLLGVYALTELLCQSTSYYQNQDGNVSSTKVSKASIKIIDILKHYKIIIKSCLTGIIIGAIPGTGGGIASWMSYDSAKRNSKHQEEFGNGSVEGLIAAECSNNAVTGATLIPLLTIGIPGDAAVAILLGALTMQNIIPGKALFESGSIWVYAIMGGLILVNIFMFIQGNWFNKVCVNVCKIPKIIMIPCVSICCVIGAFAISNTIFDSFLVLFTAAFGFIARKFDFPIPPLAISVILGELLESNYRRSLILSDGSYSIFFTRPICLVILILAGLSIFLPYIKKIKIKRIVSNK